MHTETLTVANLSIDFHSDDLGQDQGVTTVMAADATEPSGTEVSVQGTPWSLGNETRICVQWNTGSTTIGYPFPEVSFIKRLDFVLQYKGSQTLNHNRIGSSASGSGAAAPIAPIRINKPRSMPARSAPRRRRVWCWRLALGTVPRSKRATTAPMPWTSISFASPRGVRVPGRHLALQHGQRSKEPSLACLSLGDNGQTAINSRWLWSVF